MPFQSARWAPRWAPYAIPTSGRPSLPPADPPNLRPTLPTSGQPSQSPADPTRPSLPRPPLTPVKQRAKELDRDTRLRIQTLREYAHWSYADIAQAVGVTRRQVQWACEGPLTPQKTGTAKKRASKEQIHALQEFLHEDPRHRQIPWADLRYLVPGFEDWGTAALHSLMASLHYKRIRQGLKLPLSAKTRQLRFNFANWALERYPTEEHWVRSGLGPFLWSDEVWYFNQPLRGQRYITVHDCEDPATFALIKQKGHGFMFWGSFAGRVKGPTYFWPDQTSIDGPEYCRHILPLICDWLEAQGDPDIRLQQDNASAHRSRLTQAWLRELEILTVLWPPNSPDLNPIENLWKWMKNWLELHYNLQQLTPLQLRAAVQAAWEAVPLDLLERLARSMIRRLQKVKENGGDQIDY